MDEQHSGGTSRRPDSDDLPTPAPVDLAVRRLLCDRPSFHGHGTMRWDVSTGTLELLAGLLTPGIRTLEVGLGATTVIFAANPGGSHTAVSPSREEFHRVVAYCRQIDVDPSSIAHLHGRSDRMLPDLDGRFDLVLIDGAHSFPYAIVDYHYVSQLLEPGGVLVLDDLPIPAVQTLHRFLLSDPCWDLVTIADNRAAAFRLRSKLPSGDPWRQQPYNRTYPDYSFLSPSRRTRVQLASRLSRSARLRRLMRESPRLAVLLRRVRRFLT